MRLCRGRLNVEPECVHFRRTAHRSRAASPVSEFIAVVLPVPSDHAEIGVSAPHERGWQLVMPPQLP